MKKSLGKFLIFILFFSNFNSFIFAQCANNSNVVTFNYNGKIYEIIKEKKNWVNAAACAVERGGILAEINDEAENTEIFNQLINAKLTFSNTISSDGGNGAYVWIGGNDLTIEGNWVWDGDNNNMSTQFWSGDRDGSEVGGLYNNWGNEPDDFLGQDALGLSLNGWPLGVAGEWNDVAARNLLYFVVEKPGLKADLIDLNYNVGIYPNPVTNHLSIESNDKVIEKVIISNSIGQEIKQLYKIQLESNQVDFSNMDNGIYILKISFENGISTIKKIVKQ